VRAAALMVALLLLAAVMPAQAQDDVRGRWATPGVAAVVELAPCADTSTLCGTIRWLWDAVDEKGRPRLDAQNVDASLRARPLLGLSILTDLARAPAGGWSSRIYNPEDGQTYRATLRRTGADALLVEGCVLFICQKQVWRKASAVADALRQAAARTFGHRKRVLRPH
jgi:uncharacterized protein (DUF2147 family)